MICITSSVCPTNLMAATSYRVTMWGQVLMKRLYSVMNSQEVYAVSNIAVYNYVVNTNQVMSMYYAFCRRRWVVGKGLLECTGLSLNQACNRCLMPCVVTLACQAAAYLWTLALAWAGERITFHVRTFGICIVTCALF